LAVYYQISLKYAQSYTYANMHLLTHVILSLQSPLVESELMIGSGKTLSTSSGKRESGAREKKKLYVNW
jgi:hypothetical protein